MKRSPIYYIIITFLCLLNVFFGINLGHWFSWFAAGWCASDIILGLLRERF